MKYFLGRVSSKEQNLARQLKVAREKFDIPDENVYCDKITGSSFDRPQYNALKAIVQEGDEVIVKEFDRFGRNKDEMKRELEWFKQKGVIVRILDIPTIVSAKVPNSMINQLYTGGVDTSIFRAGTLTVYDYQLDAFNQAVSGTIKFMP